MPFSERLAFLLVALVTIFGIFFSGVLWERYYRATPAAPAPYFRASPIPLEWTQRYSCTPKEHQEYKEACGKRKLKST